ncbi:MAG: hypothetical protein KF832_01595 [Caldilineaceae bacterium]|nr:hypothetical protein [Caldilineaceae bacterium]
MSNTLLTLATWFSPVLTRPKGRVESAAKQLATTISPPAYLSAEEPLYRARLSRLALQGKVRWSVHRLIIEWQTKQEEITGNFAIYRGHTLHWNDAVLLDLSIFTTVHPTGEIAYRAVDIHAIPPGPYFYWIVKLTTKHKQLPFGPYIGQLEPSES